MDSTNKEIIIIHECLKGNTEAFRELIMLYQTAVYATAFYYVKEPSLAKEIAQESFLSAFKNLPHLKDITKFGRWLKEITIRTSLQYLKNHKEESLINLEDKKIISINPNENKASSTTLDEIKNAIEQLPERYRLPVVLKFLEGMTYDEISRFTGESPGEIKGILQRAIKHLQKIILDNSDGETNQWQDVRK